MRVCVEEAFPENLPEIGVQQPVGDQAAVDTGSLDSLQIGDLDSFDVLQYQHAPRRMAAVDERNVDPVHIGKHLGEAFGVVRLQLVIQLFPERFGEPLQQRRYVGAPAQRRVAHRPPRDDTQGGEVGLHQPFDARTLHLDDDRSASFEACIVRDQPGPVRLAERGSSQRLWFDVGKMAIQVAQLGAHHVEHRLAPFWRHLVLQPLQLFGDLRRQNVHAGAEELAELDQDAAHLDGELAKAAGDPSPAPRARRQNPAGREPP